MRDPPPPAEPGGPAAPAEIFERHPVEEAEPVDLPSFAPDLSPAPRWEQRPLLKPLPRALHVRKQKPEPVAPAAPAPPVPIAKVVRTDPAPLAGRCPAVRYPSRAVRLGLEGTVVLLLHVTAEGAVERAQVAESSGHEVLDRAALACVEGWRFSPGRLDGRAVAMAARVPIEFRLSG